MQLEPRPDHPVLPEADDLARGRVDVARVVALELGRLLRPAERRERPERRREPRVEHVRVALELGRAALGARVRRRPGAGDVAVGAVPERQLVAPPELARDVPVGDLLERADRELVLRLRVVADAPLAQRLERRLARLLHRAPPLQRDERLDPRVAALAGADRVPVALALLEPVVLPQPGEDASSASSCVSPASSPASSFIRPSGPITVSIGRPWSRPISKSIGSWPGVTLSAPVPNSGSTRSSAITGTRRSTNGTSTSLPIASR